MTSDWEKVTGRQRCAVEFRLPSMLFAVTVNAPAAFGQVLRIEKGVAEARPGVVAVLSADTVLSGAAKKLSPLLGELLSPRLTQAGQPVALVVAETHDQAMEAARTVRVQVRSEPACLTLTQALALGRLETAQREAIGQPAEAFSHSLHRWVHTYRLPARAISGDSFCRAIALFRGDELSLFSVGLPGEGLAARLSLLPEQIHAVSTQIGAETPAFEPAVCLAVIAAAQFQRPVQVSVDVPCGVFSCPETIQTVQLGLDEDANPKAMLVRGTVAISEKKAKAWIAHALALGRLYGFAHIEASLVSAKLNAPMSAEERGLGPDFGFGIDRIIDEAAMRLGEDPIALRLRWLSKPTTEHARILEFSLRELQRLRVEGQTERVVGQPAIGAGIGTLFAPLSTGGFRTGAHLVEVENRAHLPLFRRLITVLARHVPDSERKAETQKTRRQIDRALRMAWAKPLRIHLRTGFVSLAQPDEEFRPAGPSVIRFLNKTNDVDELVPWFSDGSGLDAATQNALWRVQNQPERISLPT